MKSYKKQNDKYGTYFKCLKCYARSDNEAYIKSQICHRPVIKTNSMVGISEELKDTTNLSAAKALVSDDHYRLAMAKKRKEKEKELKRQNYIIRYAKWKRFQKKIAKKETKT